MKINNFYTVDIMHEIFIQIFEKIIFFRPLLLFTEINKIEYSKIIIELYINIYLIYNIGKNCQFTKQK